MLVEAQLEKQSDNQVRSEEMEQVHEQVKSTSLEPTLLLKQIVFVISYYLQLNFYFCI